MATNPIKLPPGFTLDKAAASKPVKLPQGFTLDAQAQIDQLAHQNVTPPDVLGPVGNFIATEGPPMIGAVGGGIAGAAGGPAGIVGGAMLGAGGAEAAAQLMRRALGQPQVPAGSTTIAPPTPEGRIAEQMVFGGMQEAGKALTFGQHLPLPTSLTTPEAQLGREFNVPMTRPQRLQLGAPVSAAMEPITRRSLLGYPIYRKFDEKVAGRIKQAAEKVASEIDPVRRTTKQYGEGWKAAVDQFEKARGHEYEVALQDISQHGGGNAPLDVPSLASEAKNLLDSINLTGDYAEVLKKGGADAESLNFAIKRLEMLSKAEKEVPGQTSSLVNAYGQSLATPAQTVPKELNWEDARRLRTVLYDLSNRGESDIGKGAIKKFNQALTAKMGEALDNAGLSPQSNAFQTASTNYKAMRDILDNAIVAQIRKTDKPALIMRQLLTSDPESAVEVLMKVAPNKQSDLARAFFQTAWNRSAKEGIPVGNAFEKVWGDLPDGAKKQLFANNPAALERVEKLAKLVDTVNLSRNLTKPLTAQGASLMAMGNSSAILGGGAAGFLLNPSLKGALAGAFLPVITPGVMAYIATRPGATEVLQLALKTSAKSPQAAKIAARLATLVARVPDSVRKEDEANTPWVNYPRTTAATQTPAATSAEPPTKYPKLRQLLGSSVPSVR